MPAGPPVIVLISTDPRSSHRANEALRIALGIAAGETDVAVVLTGAATHLLDEDTDDLVDGDDILKFRAALKKLGLPFHVDSLREEAGWNADGHVVIPVDAAGVAALAAKASRFLVF